MGHPCKRHNRENRDIMRDKAQRTGLVKLAKGVANADTMQALEAKTPSMRAATTVDETTGNTGRALASQLQKATASGVAAQNDMGVGVLAAALTVLGLQEYQEYRKIQALVPQMIQLLNAHEAAIQKITGGPTIPPPAPTPTPSPPVK